MSASVYVVLFFCLQSVLSQGTGSGDNGSLRVCIVEGRGPYKRDQKYCPILDQEKSGVQCVLGKDRLDCLRRISKGSVDFGVFSPEDLMAAQWAELNVLVTSEIRQRPRPFARSIVAVVKKSILPDSSTNIHAVLKNRTLCLPGESTDELRPLSETLSGYLDTLITVRSCDPRLSSTENKLKSLADYYGKACKAGPWVPDPTRDIELKREFPSLCAACSGRSCSKFDPYYGAIGALTCITEGEGDITWGEAADVTAFFKQGGQAVSQNFAYLCRDGTWKGLNDKPCVWLHRPWDIIVSKRKAAEAVIRLTNLLTNNTLTVDNHWKGSLIALLESNTGLTEPLQPPLTPQDYLAKAEGFTEAYSQTGCDPPRHITLCTTSLLARNKCEWMSEGGGVYGIVPSIQCYVRENTTACLKAVADGECDAAVGDSDDIIYAHGLSLKPLLHEISFKNLAIKPMQDKTNTVVAYVKSDSGITKMADLRGKRAAFPRFNGATWHTVQRYITEHEKLSCKGYLDGYFGEICAPGMDGKNCYEAGETEALKSLLEKKSDVAFISKSTYNAYKVNNNVSEDKIVPVCPEDNPNYCFLGWSNIGHIFTANNLTAVRQHEILNVFTKLDQIFGSSSPFHNPMFLMYAAYNHTLEVIFHSNTKKLASTDILKAHPYNKIPFNFELSITNVTDFKTCSFGAKITPSIAILFVTLVTFFVSS